MSNDTHKTMPKNRNVGVSNEVYKDLNDYRDILSDQLNINLSISDVVGKLLYDQLTEK